MKVRFIFSMLVALFIAGSTFAKSESSSKYEGPKVVLKGEIGRETGRSVPVIPIEVTIGDDSQMHITFDALLGTVQILVDGQLQETCQVATFGQETSVSLEGLAPGIHKLEFKISEGGYVYGDFIIEE